MASADLLCSSGIVALAAAALFACAVRAWRTAPAGPAPGAHGWAAARDRARALALASLEPVVRVAIRMGVSASAITACSLLLGAASGVLLALGHFGVAGVAIVLASLGDCLDGLVARRTNTATLAGALFDASVDRYEEFFILSGLALYFRAHAAVLILVLAGLLGSFMVSYGSAKAEALRVVVPPGWMRRAERAACLSLGTIAVPLAGAAAHGIGLPRWTATAPLMLSLGVLAVVANVSAARRLRLIAVAASPAQVSEASRPSARHARAAELLDADARG